MEKPLSLLNEDWAVGATATQQALIANTIPEAVTCRGAQSEDCAQQNAVSADIDSQQVSSQHLHRCAVLGNRPKEAAGFAGHQECLFPGTLKTPSTQGHHGPASRCPKPAGSFRAESSLDNPRPPVGFSTNNEEELPSLAFFLDSQLHLLPLDLDQSPVCPAHEPLPRQGRGLSCVATTTRKSKKRVHLGGPIPATKKTRSGSGLGALGGQALALGCIGNSQAQKRSRDPMVSRRKKRQR